MIYHLTDIPDNHINDLYLSIFCFCLYLYLFLKLGDEVH